MHEKLQFLNIHRRRRHGGAGVQELARDPEGGTVNKLCWGAPEVGLSVVRRWRRMSGRASNQVETFSVARRESFSWR